MAYIKLSYDEDLSKIGTVVEVEVVEARRMVRDGRGKLTRKPAEPAKKAAAKKAPAKKAAKQQPAPEPAAVGPTEPDVTPDDQPLVQTMHDGKN